MSTLLVSGRHSLSPRVGSSRLSRSPDHLQCADSVYNARLHVLSLHPELQGEIADSMDLESALLWRSICLANYTHVTASLQRSLRRLVSRYVPHVTSFLQLLTKNRAVIGGVVALAYVLRDEQLYGGPLQVYVADTLYASFVDGLRLCPSNGRHVQVIGTGNPGAAHKAQREISGFTTVQFSGRPVVVIYQSATVTPLSCISRAPSSVLMNFVTAHSFGCAFPKLTANRRSLLCDLRLKHESPTDLEVMDVLLRNGFRFAVSPSAWTDIGLSDRGGGSHPHWEHALQNTMPCLREKYICPQQGRYFGDRGSSVALVDPLDPELSTIRILGVPPYGPMVAWRLLTSFECSKDCDELDGVLDNSLVSVPLLVLPSPFPVSARISPGSRCTLAVFDDKYYP